MEISLLSGLSESLALAAYLLGLSIFVQILQEMYKFLRSSKNAVYREVLRDALGSIWKEVERSGLLANLQGRRPSQFLRRGAAGNLLPLEKEPLVAVLELTAPAWTQRMVTTLRAEIEDQKTSKPVKWSPDWEAFLNELVAVNEKEAGGWTARDLKKFLAERGHLKPPVGDGPYAVAAEGEGRLAAEPLLAQARRRFLAHVVQAETNYPLIQRNFDFAYRRQNLRLTFTLGFAVAVLFNLPFEALYRRAASLTPQQAVELAERSTALYQKVSQSAATGVSPAVKASPAEAGLRDLETSVRQLNEAVIALAPTNRGGSTVNYIIDWSQVQLMWTEGGLRMMLRFLFGCLLTAALVSFGAPFWNDLVGRLMPIVRSSTKAESATTER